MITLHLKEDAVEYLKIAKLTELIRHYNEFITFPISIWDSREEVVEEPAIEKQEEETPNKGKVFLF
jgi:heat shock protein beta